MIQFSLKRISTVGPKCGPGWGGVGLSQTRPIPRSPDGDNNCYLNLESILYLYSTTKKYCQGPVQFIIHSDSLRLKKGFYEKLEPQGILQGHHGHNTTGLEQNSVHLLIGNEELHICCTKIEKDSTPQFSSSPPDLPGTNHLHLR